MNYTAEEIAQVLTNHSIWLNGKGGERANLKGANLSGADLGWANLSRADLRGADLRGADLRGAGLTRADLSRADVSGADVSGADLRGANLRGANLSWTDLTRADLRGTNLREVNLSWTDLTGAGLIVLALPGYTAYVQKTHTRIGCKYYTNEEWLLFSDDEISDMGPKDLQFWKTYKDVISAVIKLHT